MKEFSAKDIKYFWDLSLTVVVFNNGNEIMRGNRWSHPQIKDFFNQKEYSFFIPYENKYRFLKYLTGQIFIGYFCTLTFGSIAGMLFIMMFFLKDLKAVVFMSPLFLITASVAALNCYIAKRAHKRLVLTLEKYK